MSEENKRAFLSEDWIVVVAGFAIIILLLAGVQIPAPSFKWSTASDLANNVLASANLVRVLYQFLLVFCVALVCNALAGKRLKHFLTTFLLVFFLTLIALVLAGNAAMRDLNLEAVIFSLMTGLIVGNVFRLPEWLRSSLSTELFVKIGLVLLGTGIIFGDILRAGSLGLVQALLVVLGVWYFAYWLCKRLRLDDELAMMISSAVSICGVSAAIATAGAIRGDSKKLSYVISLVLITAIPMMVIMPYAARAMGLSQEVTGAWLGGTIDTTGAVVASGTLVGETALKVSTIVKFSQNVLLGIAAFAISIYWTYTRRTPDGVDAKPTARVLWDRFPKFVLGFVAASLLFSFVVDSALVAAVKEPVKSIQTLWFVLAFTSIGLETRFSDLVRDGAGRPFAAFITAQGFNILLTLIVAYFLFG